MANYEKELRMGIDIKKKKDGENNRVYSKNEKSAKGSRSSVKKSTERDKATNKQRREEDRKMESKRQGNAEYERSSIQREASKKLVDRYVDPYTIEKIVSTNAVRLQLPTSMRIHLVMNVSQIV